jgi:hypothetical protein
MRTVLPAIALLLLASCARSSVLTYVSESHSSRATIIYKNQLHPSIDEIEARAAAQDPGGEANSDEGFITQRQGQEI